MGLGQAQAAETDTRLGTVQVKGKKVDSAQEAAKEEIREVPGGASLVSSEQVEQGRVATNADILAYQPGVYAQSAGGGDGIKISIRGSGINRGAGFFRSGILFEFDGLPVTGPGGTPYELFEPLGLSYTEVLRGANGFDHGALALGGAINYVTKTGYDADRLQARYEFGSWAYRKYQVSSGQVIDNFDYFVSLTDSARDGFQDQTKASSQGIAGNFGYRFSPELETRFYYRYRETDNETPGNLTRAQIEDDPSQAVPLNQRLDLSRVQQGSTWIANKTSLVLDERSSLEVGAVFHDYPIDIRSTERSLWSHRDASLSLKYLREDSLFGLASKSRLGLLSTTQLDGGVHTYGNNPALASYKRLLKVADYSGSADHVIFGSNELEVAPDLWLITGLSWINNKRESKITFPIRDEFSRNAHNWAPRLGLRYDLNPDVQLFTNLSKSVEPANSWSFPGGSSSTTLFHKNLKEQKAVTFEVGARAQLGIFAGSLSLYRSEVKDELLTVELFPATATSAAVITEANASDTIHQGIELGLDTLLWGASDSHKLVLRQSYTLNDFYYEDDATFGDNQLPGIPKHFYQAELRYDHPTGFYAGVNLQSASAYPVDFANTFNTASYTIFGATLGYDHPGGDWQAYLDFKNLTNEFYAATVSPGFNDRGLDAARSTPGDKFGVFGGVSVAF
ncbi:TonB-dependent receptor family protein [Pseudomonas sp. GCM10022186]|uniref:TonB-dependent receptor family protein n=1 Tax=Pseudomonas sp. GCM10022186 TaxID=3252650 RepID=UPI00361BB627